MNESQAVSRESWQSASEKAVQLLPIEILKSNAILARAVPAQQTFLCALQANLQQMPSHRHHRSWQANRLIWLVWNVMKPSENLGWLVWNVMKPSENLGWLVWNVMKPSENLGPQITKSSMVGIPWYSISIPWYPMVSHGIPWYPILLSFKMQLPDGRLLQYYGKLSCAFAGHGAGFLTWSRSTMVGMMSLEGGWRWDLTRRGSTSTYFNTEHSSWFDCFLAKCRILERGNAHEQQFANEVWCGPLEHP